jgi:ribonuclease Z
MISPFSFMRIKAIFISHLHGDHLLGIPGLLQTMSMSGRKEEILLVGPIGFKNSVDLLLEASRSELDFVVDIIEADNGDKFVFKEFIVGSFSVKHSPGALGFVFEENERPGKFDRAKAESLGLVPGPDYTRIRRGETVNGVSPKDVIGPAKRGRKIVYSGDTVKCRRTVEMAKDADLLIHEATYSVNDSALAEQHMHSTSHDAASIAVEAGVSLLAVTHISNRYDDVSIIENECREIFSNTVVAKDMMMLTIR